jgi:hypothetical protein
MDEYGRMDILKKSGGFVHSGDARERAEAAG